MKKRRSLLNLPDDVVYGHMETPVGLLTLFTSHKGLHAILWEKESETLNLTQKSKCEDNHPLIVETKKQLSDYFNHTRKHFSLPLVLKGTPFQINAWQVLLSIPYGTTISYGEQAVMLGDKNKSRAVGMANGCNPLPIIIPCHRVIGAKGNLTGFGGGLDRKSRLLALEEDFKPLPHRTTNLNQYAI